MSSSIRRLVLAGVVGAASSVALASEGAASDASPSASPAASTTSGAPPAATSNATPSATSGATSDASASAAPAVSTTSGAPPATTSDATPSMTSGATAPSSASVDSAPLPFPRPWLLSGTATEYAPLLDARVWRGVRVEVPLSLAGRGENVSAFALDRAGTATGGGATLSPRARLGLRVTGDEAWAPLTLLAEYEQDLPTGTLGATPATGLGMPGSDAVATQLRKASLRVGYGNKVVVGGGVMTSHFGLGLLANDGDHGWEPGSARFADPRGGDRVLRGFIASGPHTPLGLVVSLGVDRVLDDDSLLLAEELGTKAGTGDAATQVIGSATIGRPGRSWAGVYVAHRDQRAADGRTLAVTAVDGSATTRRTLWEGAVLSLGAEAAFIAGDTTLTGTPTFPTQAVRQLGLAARGGLDLGTWGAALDGVYASGDRNVDDGSQNAFRVDPNFELGLLMFRQVLAAQTGRAVAVAGDPQLVGAPVPGLERVPTRGAVTNTLAVFPRLFVRPIQGLEVYGGVLLAWSAMPLVDPFNTRVSGGSVRNALDGRPSGWLGTEYDAGARVRGMVAGVELSVGVEGGVFVPGGAFRNASGTMMGPVVGGRGVLGVRL